MNSDFFISMDSPILKEKDSKKNTNGNIKVKLLLLQVG